MGCTSGYKFPASGLGQVDFDDVFVRKEFFSEGGLWNWGGDISGTTTVLGKFGDNANVNRSSPVQTVSGGTNWKQVSIGFYSSAAVKTDGTLWLWGWGTSGELGNNAVINRSSPVQTVSGGTNWKQVSVGNNRAAAVKSDGTLWTWGLGICGSLGTNDLINRSSPVQTVSGGTNWKEVIASNGETMAAIKTDGTLWLWGLNDKGQLGTNDRISTSSPVQTVSGGTNWKQTSSGDCNTVAIKTDGTLWLWGSSSIGQLGNQSIVDSSSPVQTVSGGTNWKQVSVGRDHVAAIKTDGTFWVWGNNCEGGLGRNDRISTSSPVQTVSGGTYWKQVMAGWLSTSAISEDCW
jgi:alpha-tubulin suppressor-like RCC1 family protein